MQTELTLEQIRYFRLHAHHLDQAYPCGEIMRAVGACGMQNSPPGAWETALFNRVPGCGLKEMERLLYEEKTLLQAWSLRGIPVVFPAGESRIFLSALIPQGEEPWIYTNGIGLALDYLDMTFGEVLERLEQVMPQLDGRTLTGKTALDQTLAAWMTPLIPAEKRERWSHPSMYGSPDKQTVGGAAVSFLLRPCSYSGLVVFGQREGISPTFTSYKSWLGHPLPDADRSGAEKELVRKFLHCYGPATSDSFARWLGCSGKQARRMWNAVSEEMEPVFLADCPDTGKKRFILSEDRALLFSPPSPERELLLLGGHDPFLDQRDRAVLQPDPARQKQIWKLVSNPGAVVCRGRVIGTWSGKKKNRGMEIGMTLWEKPCGTEKLQDLAEACAAFRGRKLLSMEC